MSKVVDGALRTVTGGVERSRVKGDVAGVELRDRELAAKTLVNSSEVAKEQALGAQWSDAGLKGRTSLFQQALSEAHDGDAEEVLRWAASGRLPESRLGGDETRGVAAREEKASMESGPARFDAQRKMSSSQSLQAHGGVTADLPAVHHFAAGAKSLTVAPRAVVSGEETRAVGARPLSGVAAHLDILRRRKQAADKGEGIDREPSVQKASVGWTAVKSAESVSLTAPDKSSLVAASTRPSTAPKRLQKPHDQVREMASRDEDKIRAVFQQVAWRLDRSGQEMLLRHQTWRAQMRRGAVV